MGYKPSNKLVFKMKSKCCVNSNANSHKIKKKCPYFHCKKVGHIKAECKLLRSLTQHVRHKKFIVVISVINLLQDDGAWWIRNDATKNVFKDNNFFKSIKSVSNETVLQPGNSSTA